MLDAILAVLPPQTHALVLAGDPDGILCDPEVQAALAARGFRLVDTLDPIALRYQVEQARPFHPSHLLVIRTAGPLEALPYDLWQQGVQVDLSLPRFFPGLDYAVLQELSRLDLDRLAEQQAQLPTSAAPLGRTATCDYLLRLLWGIDLGPGITPDAWLAWLGAYHTRQRVLPAPLAARLRDQLQRLPAFATLPVADLLADPALCRRYTGASISERDPIQVHDTRAGYEASSHAVPFMLGPELAALTDNLTVGIADWESWQAIAWRWARITRLRYDSPIPHPATVPAQFAAVAGALDAAFAGWLTRNYSALAGQALPIPHHLYHVPGWLAYAHRPTPGQRVALLVLDVLALADWLLIAETWQVRHPTWQFDPHLVLAQVPTVTSVSRQALVSGRRPAQFAASLDTNARESQEWQAFWETTAHLPAGAAAYAALAPTLNAPYPAALDSRRTQALCLISPIIDTIVHGASQGAASVQAALRVWLDDASGAIQGSRWLEGLVSELLTHGYRIVLTSDHGHVEAVGMGQPQEGVLAQSRNKRARVYGTVAAVAAIQASYPDTIVWHNDGLLPADRWVLMPQGRRAFATPGEVVVSHGGLTIDEVIVPLVTITGKDSHG
jgi:hypothetical protein